MKTNGNIEKYRKISKHINLKVIFHNNNNHSNNVVIANNSRKTVKSDIHFHPFITKIFLICTNFYDILCYIHWITFDKLFNLPELSSILLELKGTSRFSASVVDKFSTLFMSIDSLEIVMQQFDSLFLLSQSLCT